jgi:hypothetical protein
MTPAEINRAIAESMGWTNVEIIPPHPRRLPEGSMVVGRPPEKSTDRSPIVSNYHGDLNACAEFERALLGGNAKQNIHSTNRYTNELCKLLQCLDTALFQFATATAPQRCEAYLKTIGKWRGQ